MMLINASSLKQSQSVSNSRSSIRVQVFRKAGFHTILAIMTFAQNRIRPKRKRFVFAFILFLSCALPLALSGCNIGPSQNVGKLYRVELSGIRWSKDSRYLSFLYSNVVTAGHYAPRNYFVGVIDTQTKQYQVIKTFENASDIVGLYDWTPDNKIVIRASTLSLSSEYNSISLDGKMEPIFEGHEADINSLGSYTNYIKDQVTFLSDGSGLVLLNIPTGKNSEFNFFDLRSKTLSKLDFLLPEEFKRTPGDYLGVFAYSACVCHGAVKLYFSNTMGNPIDNVETAYHYYANIDTENKKIINAHLFKSYPKKNSTLGFFFMGWLSQNEMMYTLYHPYTATPSEKNQYFKLNIDSQKEEELFLPNYGPLSPQGTLSPDASKIVNFESDNTLSVYDLKTKQNIFHFDAFDSFPKGAYEDVI